MFEDDRRSDAPPPPEWSAEEWASDLKMAGTFLTRLPIGPGEMRPLDLSRAARAFPVVGALVGAASGLVAVLCQALGMSDILAAAFGIGAAVVVTGALHEDGLADTADGFWGGTTKEARLGIMRDSRIGTYGALALLFSSLIKIAATAELIDEGAIAALMGLIGAEAVSRHAMVALLAGLEPARTEGLAAGAGRPLPESARTSLLVTLAIGIPALWLAGGVSGLALAAGLAVLGIVGIRDLARRYIGGQSGDVCGAVQQVTAAAVLTGLAMAAS